MDLEEANGLKEARKERNSIPIGSVWYRKVRMGHCRLEVMQTKKVRN